MEFGTQRAWFFFLRHHWTAVESFKYKDVFRYRGITKTSSQKYSGIRMQHPLTLLNQSRTVLLIFFSIIDFHRLCDNTFLRKNTTCKQFDCSNMLKILVFVLTYLQLLRKLWRYSQDYWKKRSDSTRRQGTSLNSEYFLRSGSTANFSSAIYARCSFTKSACTSRVSINFLYTTAKINELYFWTCHLSSKKERSITGMLEI